MDMTNVERLKSLFKVRRTAERITGRSKKKRKLVRECLPISYES